MFPFAICQRAKGPNFVDMGVLSDNSCQGGCKYYKNVEKYFAYCLNVRSNYIKCNNIANSNKYA